VRVVTAESFHDWKAIQPGTTRITVPVRGIAHRRGAGAVVRLRRREDGAVPVRSCAAKSRAVSNRNCLVARRGGEHRNENDQSVTQTAPCGLPW
jgi:hypothetical protein